MGYGCDCCDGYDCGDYYGECLCYGGEDDEDDCDGYDEECVCCCWILVSNTIIIDKPITALIINYIFVNFN